jgi:hypothetical protein
MQLVEQVEFLVRLGERLDNWVRPGDVEDTFLPGVPLISGAAKALQFPARVIDVLMARWIRVKDYLTQKPVALLIGPPQRDFSAHSTTRDIILKSGKTWFTTYCAQRNFLRIVTRQGHSAVLIAHEQKPAEDYFEQIHTAWGWLPGKLGEVLRAGALRQAKANVREMYFPEMNSHFQVATAGAAAAGLGLNYQYLHCTEFSRWGGDVRQTMATLTSHLVGLQTEQVIESRPHGDSGEFHERYWKARRGESDFRAHFYPWWWNPGHAAAVPRSFSLSEEERSLCRRYQGHLAERPTPCLSPKLSAAQIMWRRGQAIELTDLLGQEFAEDEAACFLGSSDCPFSAMAIAQILRESAVPIEREIATGLEENGWLCWTLPEKGHEYVIFCDPAGGQFKSRSAFQVIDRETAEQVGEWVGRDAPLQLAARMRAAGLRFNRALIAVETNLGDISATILSGLSGYPNLYWRTDPGGAKKLGWKTDGITRPAMFDLFGLMLASAPYCFKSRRLAEDAKTHVRADDRIEPRKGFTGDLTIAMAGALKVRERSTGTRKPWTEALAVGGGPDEERYWKKA